MSVGFLASSESSARLLGGFRGGLFSFFLSFFLCLFVCLFLHVWKVPRNVGRFFSTALQDSAQFREGFLQLRKVPHRVKMFWLFRLRRGGRFFSSFVP